MLGSNEIKDQHETMKLQYEVHLKPWLLMNWDGSSQCIFKWENSQKKATYLYLQYTNIDKVKIFCVLHDKVALLRRRYSERETRNRHQRIFRKVLTMKTLIRRWIFHGSETDNRLPFHRSLSTFRIYLVVFALFYSWAWVRRSDVKSFVKLSHGTTIQT